MIVKLIESLKLPSYLKLILVCMVVTARKM